MSLKFLIYPILISLLMTTPTQAAPDHNILNQNDYILVKTRTHAEALAKAHIANAFGKTVAIQQKPYQVQETPQPIGWFQAA